MNTITFAEAQHNLGKIMDAAVKEGSYTQITRPDAQDVVLMSLDSFNGLMETVYLLRSSANMAHLTRSIAEYNAGQVASKAQQN